MSREAGRDRMQNTTEEVKQFDNLFHQHKTAVFRYACYLTQNKDEAEDIFQETWLRVTKNFSKTKDVRNFKAWIFTITANLFRDALRKKTNSEIIDESKTNFSGKNSKSNEMIMGTQNQIQFNESDRIDVNMAINQAMMRLPLKQKQIFILKEIEGFKLIEISSILNIPMGTVKSLLHRAVKHLRKSLQDFRNDTKRIGDQVR